MRIASGTTDQYIYFVAVDATDYATREVGLAAKMKVKRSRNGGAATYYATPTINETDTGLPGVYELLVDEDTTIDAGDFTQAYLVDIRDTGGHMARITREIELFRPSDTGGIADAIWAKDSRALTAFAFDTGVQQAISRLDTGLSETIDRTYAKVDTGISAEITAIDATTVVANLSNKTDTGVPLSVWESATRTLTALGANVIDTGTFTGTAALANDTGALEASISAGVWSHAARELTGFAFDTGIQQALARVDTGLSETIDRTYAKVDTGISAEISAIDATTLVSNLSNKTDTGVPLSVWESVTRSLTAFALDTGIADTVWKYSTSGATADTGSVGYAQGRIMAVKGDTGAAHLDQGRFGVLSDSGRAAAVLDTGKVSNAVWDSLLSGASHNTANSGGRRLRTLNEGSINAEGTIAAVTNSRTVTLDAGAVAVAGYYEGNRLQITEGTGVGQGRIITRYTAGRVATLDTPFITNPDTSSLYDVISADAKVSVNDADLAEGVVGVYTNLSTITLDTGAASDTGFYTGDLIIFTNGSGKGQAREIITYAANRVLTMAPPLITPVDTGTSWHIMAAADVVSLSNKLDTGTGPAVWATASRTLTAFQFDTGVAQTVWRESGSTYSDTGSLGYALDQRATAASSVDTGVVNQAVWQADATSAAVGRIVALGSKLSDSGTLDTGTIAGDTGATSRFLKFTRDKLTDSGTFDTGTGVLRGSAATIDTGVVHDAVWNVTAGDSNRTLTNIDTGAAIHLAQLADEYDTGRLPAEATATLDTGAVHDAVWNVAPGDSNRLLTGIDTGAAVHLAQMADEYDTGRLPAEATATLDTGLVHDAVWNVTAGDNTRALTTFGFDTGVAQTVWRESGSTYVDTGSLGYALDQRATTGASIDTGQVNQAVWQADASRTLTGWTFDTGVQQAIARLDTGLSETIDRTYAKVDTGISAEISAIDSTTLVSNLSNKVDTGVPLSVWQSATRTITSFGFDTGVAQTVWRESGSSYSDTGSLGYALDQRATTGASIDTGQVNQAVWQGDASRTLTAWAFDTGVQQKLDRIDTGLSETIDRTYAKLDTGISAEITAVDATTLVNNLSNKVDTGVPVSVWQESGSTYTDTGSLGYALDNIAATIDTGQVNQAVWNADASRTLTAWAFDTGVQQALARLDTGMTETIDRTYAKLDTGISAEISLVYAKADTGYAAELSGLSNKLDTGAPVSVWQESGSTYTDTGSLGYALDNIVATVDTGVVNQAVWQVDAVRTLTNIDTGAAIHLAQFADHYDTGGVTDTGKINRAVWGADAVRTLTNIDTGAALHLANLGDEYDTGQLIADTGIYAAITGVTSKLDTGTSAEISAVTTAVSQVDTGIRQQTDKLTFDTGANELHADIRKVNNVQVKGAGDTGLADTWRPVTET